MKKHVFYDPLTGEIRGYVEGSVVDVEDHHMIESERMSSDDYYVDIIRKVILPRPIMPIVANKSQIKADSTEEAVISNIPLNSTCYHDGQTIQMDEQIINFTADHPGVYKFLFEKFPYKLTSISVEAVSS